VRAHHPNALAIVDDGVSQDSVADSPESDAGFGAGRDGVAGTWGRPPDDVVDVEHVSKCHAGVTVAEGLAVAARGWSSSGVGAGKVALNDVAAVRVVGIAVAPGHDTTAGSVARGAVARDHVAGYGVVDRPGEEDSAGEAAGGGLAVAESLAAEDIG